MERPTFVESQAKGEVDTQIVTAKKFPRSMKQFKERALSLVTLDEDTAASCFYVLPARKGGDGRSIEGPSARLAEIVAGSWGNLRAQACVVDDDGEFITAQGRCWDLETNVAVSVDVRRRIVDKYGKRYSADMVNTTANAACSIALRNAVFKVVPMAIVKPIYEQARSVAIGDATTLVKRRGDAVAYFGKLGVTTERLLASLERASLEDVTIDDLTTLTGLRTAIKDGDTTIDEAFPPLEKPKPAASRSDELASKLAPAAPVSLHPDDAAYALLRVDLANAPTREAVNTLAIKGGTLPPEQRKAFRDDVTRRLADFDKPEPGALV